MFSTEDSIQPPKKTRKRKNAVVQDGSVLSITPVNEIVQVCTEGDVSFSLSNDNLIASASTTTTDVKKRGRKPKGGKLILKNEQSTENISAIPNIILHLKCSLKDLDVYKNKHNKMVSKSLNYNPEIPPDIMTYNVSEQMSNGLPYSSVDVMSPNHTGNTSTRDAAYLDATTVLNNNFVCSKCNSSSDQDVDTNNDDVSIKNIMTKMKRLKVDLYKNSILDKKSACFWCTYEYDNQICFIPKYEMDGSICGYGSFCRPECAVAYLMKEPIDDSTKFERYHLLNQIYSKVNDFKTNVKPAPDPHYLLNKFYGNLTIQEYRKLLNTEHIMLVIDKPLTRILPELHEDTDDFIIGIYGGTKGQGSTQAGGVYKVKRQSEKQVGPTKSSIMKGNFGL